MANILIVEDEASIRQVLDMHLTLVGHACRLTGDAREAREELALCAQAVCAGNRRGFAPA